MYLLVSKLLILLVISACSRVHSMRATTQTAPGSKLEVSEVPIPQLSSRQLLIEVHYSALNRMDLLQAKGSYPPPPGASPILGVEVAGIVSQVHPSCEGKWSVGEPVMALLTGGGYAEYCSADERTVMKVLPGVNLETSSAIPEAFMTAYQLLFFIAQLKAGDSVLLHAAASSIGQAAIQLAKHKGLTVFATARSADKLVRCREYGADATFEIDDKEVRFAADVKAANHGKGVTAVIDPVGSSYLAENLEVLALDGKYVLYGLMGGPAVNDTTFLSKLMAKRISILPSTLRGRSPEYKHELVQALMSDEAGIPAIASGATRVEISSVYDLKDANEAHAEMSSNRNIGKILLRVKPGDHGEESLPQKRSVEL